MHHPCVYLLRNKSELQTEPHVLVILFIEALPETTKSKVVFCKRMVSLFEPYIQGVFDLQV